MHSGVVCVERISDKTRLLLCDDDRIGKVKEVNNVLLGFGRELTLPKKSISSWSPSSSTVAGNP
ncbi:hypothetical protein BTJ68_03832 [Hortaea werneckii EXF-2000]|uniref:Uncharacterized protein n=1 Tax=Hortaea werneckii EXF-2000 TaxID=1157616 RepID=A0A1Z5THF8_HORWE|nr:hypothetical protein BTJ68_03832 [Hortaea werneckii EXF-2000]